MKKKNNQATKGLHLPVLLISLSFSFITFMMPVYSKSLGANALEIGGLFSVSTAVTLILRPFIGWMLDRFGRKPFLVSGLFFVMCSMFVHSFANSLSRLYIACFIGGFGSLLGSISIITMIADLSLSAELGKEMGKITEQIVRAGIIGISFGIFIYNIFPPREAWQLVFLVYGAMAGIALCLAWINVPETRPADSLYSFKKGDNSISKQFVKLMLIVFITNFSGFMLIPIILIYMQDMFTSDIGRLALVFLPGALAVSFLASRFGQLSDRFGRMNIIAIGIILTGIFSILIPNQSSLIWLAVLWLFFNVAQSMSGPALSARISDTVGADRRGRAYGMYDFFMFLGMSIGPLLGGWLYESIGKAIPFYINGIILLSTGGLIFLFMRQSKAELNGLIAK